MKKKLLMAAVGAALVAGPMVAAHAAGATLYGHMHLSMDRLDNDAQGTAAQERGFLSSNSSRFGIKGDEDLGGGMKAIYQIESGGFNADTGTGGFSGTLRNTFVGFAGGWGTVKLGRHDTPYKDIGRKIDNFNEQVGDARNIIGSGATASAPGNFNWDQRVSNMVRYDTPSFGGFTVAAQYATDEGVTTAPGSADVATGDVVSLAANFTAGPFWAGLGYETHKVVNQDSESGMRFAGSYTMNAFTFGLFYEDLSDLAGDSDVSHAIMGLFASMGMGNNKLKLHWFDADDYDAPGGAPSTGGSLWAIGVDHTFSKTAMVYVNYAQADNDTNGGYINVTSSNAGHGNSIGGIGGDQSPSGFSAGYILKF